MLLFAPFCVMLKMGVSGDNYNYVELSHGVEGGCGLAAVGSRCDPSAIKHGFSITTTTNGVTSHP